MVKLKCWKKFSDGSGYESKKEIVKIIKSKDKNYVVVDKIKPFSTKILKGSIKNSKSQALKFANKYMKKHDKC